MDAAYPLPPASPSEAPSSPFGTTSAVFAGLTVLLPIVIVTWIGVKATNEPNEQARAWAPVIVFFVGGFFSLLASGVSSVLGSISGAIALARHERRSWLAALGLIVNVPVALFAIYVFAALWPRG